jgi:hypothetical protein
VEVDLCRNKLERGLGESVDRVEDLMEAVAEVALMRILLRLVREEEADRETDRIMEVDRVNRGEGMEISEGGRVDMAVNKAAKEEDTRVEEMTEVDTSKAASKERVRLITTEDRRHQEHRKDPNLSRTGTSNKLNRK